jgi:molybdenum cofactor biosynthesis enzyme MoaA
MIKTCLYAKEVLDFKKMLCDGYSDQALVRAIHATVQHKAASGIDTGSGTQARCSMAFIGG